MSPAAFLAAGYLLSQPVLGGDGGGAGASQADLPSRNPTAALLRSAVLPGWGQFYNDEPVKGLVMGGVELGLLALLVGEHIAAESARYDFAESGDPADEERYISHRENRLDLIWLTSAAWLYGMLDAYVDAHLFGFVQENERFEKDIGIGAALFLRF